MGRHLPRLFIAAAIVAAAVVLGPRLMMPAIDGSGAIAAAALVISAICLAVATLSLIKARIAAKDVDRMARTLDATIRRVSADSDRTQAAIAEFSRIGEHRSIDAPPPLPVSEEPSPSNVVALPSKRARPAPDVPVHFSGDDLAAQVPLPLSLEPIVNVHTHAAAAFEAYAHLRLPGGEEHIARRLDDPDLSTAFASALIDAALLVTRRQLGEDAEHMPLHVAVPAQFLANAEEISRLVDAFRINPGLAQTIVFSLPPDLVADHTVSAGINLLARQGAAFAAEAWPSGRDPVGQLTALGATVVKLPVARLIEAQPANRGRMTGVDILDAAEGRLTLIATGVASEDQVLRLLDIGVELMSGPALSQPRRLKDLTEAAGPADRRMTPNG